MSLSSGDTELETQSVYGKPSETVREFSDYLRLLFKESVLEARGGLEFVRDRLSRDPRKSGDIRLSDASYPNSSKNPVSVEKAGSDGFSGSQVYVLTYEDGVRNTVTRQEIEVQDSYPEYILNATEEVFER